jgi:tripeptidyl-peptidase-1
MHPTIYTGLLCILAAPTLGVVWESVNGGVPSSWYLQGTPSSDSTMAIALSRQNLDQLESKLTKLSTPGEAEYGQWLEKHERDTQLPVVDDTAVVNWLKSAGISNFGRGASMTALPNCAYYRSIYVDITHPYIQASISTAVTHQSNRKYIMKGDAYLSE